MISSGSFMEEKNWWYQKTLRTHHLIVKVKVQKYFGGLLCIIIDETDLENKINQLIDDIRNFKNQHIIQCYSVTQSNIRE